MKDLHETFERDETNGGPSNRSFGMTVGGILGFLGATRWIWYGEASWLTLLFLILGVSLIAAAVLLPESLTRLNRLWIGLGFLLGRVVNPVIMLFIFVVAFVPIGLILRLRGYDPLRLRMRPDAEQTSYWIERDRASPATGDFTNQF